MFDGLNTAWRILGTGFQFAQNFQNCFLGSLFVFPFFLANNHTTLLEIPSILITPILFGNPLFLIESLLKS